MAVFGASNGLTLGLVGPALGVGCAAEIACLIIDPEPALAAVTAAALGHAGRLWPLVNLLSVELWLRFAPGPPAAPAPVTGQSTK